MPSVNAFSRLPKHVGLIPDGNRRWARARGLHPGLGYAAGLERGLVMLDECLGLGIEEVSVYGFTTDNTKRPRDQREAFAAACVGFVEEARKRKIALRVVGDASSPMFPAELVPYVENRLGEGMRVNMLVNYGWEWDLRAAVDHEGKGPLHGRLASADVSRIDLMVRWGGMRRLSGMLPVQTVYSDFYVVDELWPDYEAEQFHEALRWYAKQDVTLGG
jgi:undecaprenyl diphosphate synthase